MLGQAREEPKHAYCVSVGRLTNITQYRITAISVQDVLTTVTNAMMVT